jgi:putative peptide zinc metalloprotease protein
MPLKDDIPASDLERRKHVKLRVRTDLNIAPQKYEGRTYYVVKDPVSLRYYRFKEQEHFLIRYMDGQHTLDQAQKEFEKRFRPDRLTLEDLEHFGQQLLTAGLAQNDSPQAGQQLFDRRKKRKRTELLQTFTNILYIKIPIFDPERLLTRMLPYTRWIFTTWFLIASCLFMGAAALLVLTHFQTFYDRLPSYHEFFNFKTVIYLWAALGVVKVIHEFGHGLSCRMFGGEVHEMGFLFLCLSPCMYCNVSDAWTLPNKWKRIIISGAGIYVELMIAALATFVWWNSPSHPFINYMALSLMVVCSVSTVFFNGNPLMRYDGYYVLADWLEIPNLRDRSNRYISRLVMEHCLGIEVQPEPYMARWRRTLFLVYAVVSYIYKWVITFFILYWMANFLKPYKLEVISTLLAALALGSMVGWPIARLSKNLYKRGRLPDMKPVRVTVSAAVVAAALFGFFFVPLPVSRIRHTGVVEVQPEHVRKVFVEVSGTLDKVHVVEGQIVKKGQMLAEFSNLDLQAEELDAKSRKDIAHQLIDGYRAQLVSATDSQEKTGLKQAIAKSIGDEEGARMKWDMASKLNREHLTLRAPCDGAVMGLPKIDEVGKKWEKDQSAPFCSVGDPGRLRVLVPLTPDDYALVRDDLKEREKNGEKVPVTVRVQGRAALTWTGEVVNLPESEAKEIPIPLSNKVGGPLAIKPTSQPAHPEPQSQVFLVGINIDKPDRAIVPGVMAQVKIHCEYRSCAWWTWRAISSAFDLGLL